jgi:hypothetical protein
MRRGFLSGFRFAPVFVVFFMTVASWAQEATVVYVEGDASRKDPGGVLRRLDFADALKAGDSVITKRSGRAELELPNRSSISVRPDTVFTLGEADLEGGAKQSVLTTAVGSVACKLNKFTGTSPLIRSNSMVAGVRGTELEVFAGMDGSSLVVVTEGRVELTARGETVSLGVNEAVEVQAGGTPGQKYGLPGGSLDFSAWNTAKMNDFLKDPVTGIQRVEKQLAYFRDEMRKLEPVYEKDRIEAEKLVKELDALRAAGDTENADKVWKVLFGELNERQLTVYLNIRYYALSYLSMRRFVVGGLYLEMKSRYILKQDDPVFQSFFDVYNKIIQDYENTIVHRLNDADI